MNILGITRSGDCHDSSACLISDGKVFAIAEERISRLKHDASFPLKAIDGLLSTNNLLLENVDVVAFSYPYFDEGIRSLQSLIKNIPIGKFNLPNFLFCAQSNLLELGRIKRDFVKEKRSFFFNHHLSHATSTFIPSGFSEAAIIVIDGRGTTEATTIWKGVGNKIELKKIIRYPNSLGSFFKFCTQALGFKGLNDEWKVMGLASYGESGKFDLSNILSFRKDGSYRLNSAIAYNSNVWVRNKQKELKTPVPDNPTEIQKDFARATQDAYERAFIGIVKEAVKLTGCRRICLAGGSALNSVANGKALSMGLIDDIFVQPASNDDGAALGAAYQAYFQYHKEFPNQKFNAYLGLEYSEEHIENRLKTYKVNYSKQENISQKGAELIARGHIIGWFQGRMEFGPRALGNRSILADPRFEKNRDLVNSAVKFRESWRPFAPSVLSENAKYYFEIYQPSPHMTLTVKANKINAHKIPAVVHVDETSRVQTVTKEDNPKYYELIKEFGNITGVPVVLNTSFNLKDEPIVCSPKDAIRTFFTSGLDDLLIGNFLVSKTEAQKASSSFE